MARRYEDRYRYGNTRDYRDSADDRGYDRGYMERGVDEVRSWFGDDDAERRRRLDEQHDWDRPRHDSGSRGTDDYERYPSSRSYRVRQWRPDDWTEGVRTSSAREGRRFIERPAFDRTWSTDEGRTQFGSSPARLDPTRSERTGEFWGRGPKGYRRSDARIQEEVCDRLTYSNVDAENIEVSVANCEVTLSGTVSDRWHKREAEDVAEDIAGVREVHNNLRVRDGARFERAPDTSASREDRGLGVSDTSQSPQPGTVLGVNPTAGSHITSPPPTKRQ